MMLWSNFDVRPPPNLIVTQRVMTVVTTVAPDRTESMMRESLMHFVAANPYIIVLVPIIIGIICYAWIAFQASKETIRNSADDVWK